MFISKRSVALSLCLIQMLALSSLLSGCQFFQFDKQQAEPVEQLVQPVVEQPTAISPQEKVINVMLGEADYALSQNKLLNPISDNAHDRYRSVLLMDSKNERALLGLQTIALRFVELARTSAVRGDLANAQTMIKYARSIDNNPVVQDAAETMRKQIASMPPAKPYQSGVGEQVLDADLLKTKSPAVVTQLTAIAQKAKQTGDFVLIVAQNDADGRWIYEQLRKAVPGYLVRGDIKMGRPARVKLVSSLE